MPRGRGSSSSKSGGGFFGRSNSSSSNQSRSNATAARPQQAPAPAQSGGMFGGGGLMGTMMQGMAFGAGSEVAHQAIRGVMGGSGSHGNAQQEQVQQQAPTQNFQNTNPCMQYNNNFVEVRFPTQNYCQHMGSLLERPGRHHQNC